MSGQRIPNHKAFSLIVPTHNSSSFISNLLNSIPVREDIEIIVVDDHSDDYGVLKEVIKVDTLSKRIKLLRNNGKNSAGVARNLGMKHAIGNWIIFADSDDIFTHDFSKALDKYVDRDEDVILFLPLAKMADSDKRSDRIDYMKYTFGQFSTGKIDKKTLSYRTTPVWSKFYKREKIKNTKFEATISANDILFSMKAAFVTRNKIAVENELAIYSVTERPGSITKNKFKSIRKLGSWYIIRSRADKWLAKQLKSINEPMPRLARMKSVFRKLYASKTGDTNNGK